MLGSAALWAETINLFKMNKEIHEWLNRQVNMSLNAIKMTLKNGDTNS